MSYISDICDALSRTLQKFATLNPHQLSGHFANLDFWLTEIEHAFAIIDGYQERFERMKSAQQQHVQERLTVEFRVYVFDPIGETPSPPRPAISHEELRQLRNEVAVNAYRFILRCYHARFQSRDELNTVLQRLGMSLEKRDLGE